MNSMYNLYIPLCSLVLSVFLISLFLMKVKGFRNTENKFYFVMIIDVLIMTIMCMLAIHSIYKGYSDSFLVAFANRLECFAIFNYVSNLYMYIRLCCNSSIKKANSFYLVMNAIAFIFIMILPISLDINQELTYMVVVGPAVNLTVILAAIFIILTFILAAKNYKSLKEKIIPVILLTFFLAIIMIIRQAFPEFVCMEFLINFATLIMYHTIENPDLQIIEEYREIKDIAERQNVDKVMFLHNTTQTLKYSLIDIKEECNYVLETDSVDQLKKSVKNIDIKTRNILNDLNNVYDPKGINVSDMKIFNDNYDTKSYDNIFKSFKNMTPKNISFTYHIDTNLPSFLYGDILNIKDILKKVYRDLLEHIKTGEIKVSLNSVIDDNVCRVIIKMKDNGEGYSYNYIEKSLKNGLFKEIRDDLSKVNGAFVINSEKNKKTERIIVIDQLISLKATMKLDKLEKNSDKRRVMIVDNSKESEIIIPVLNKYNFEIIKVQYGVDCLKKVRNYEQFDLLIINEEIEPLSGIETFNKLKENIVFKTPVIMLSRKKDFKVKELYLKLGISEIVSLPVNKEEFEEVVNKYVK